MLMPDQSRLSERKSFRERVMAGYSGTPLAKKLGIKEGSRIYVIDPPTNYQKLLAPLPDGVEFVSRLDERPEIVHLFCTTRKQLGVTLRHTLRNLKDDGVLWVSWPKRASQVPTDITEDTIREIALPTGLVDIKVCAVDEVWSGLKLVLRKEMRNAGNKTGTTRANRPSHHVRR